MEYTAAGALVFVQFALTTGTRERSTLIIIAIAAAAIMPYGYIFELAEGRLAHASRSLSRYEPESSNETVALPGLNLPLHAHMLRQ